MPLPPMFAHLKETVMKFHLRCRCIAGLVVGWAAALPGAGFEVLAEETGSTPAQPGLVGQELIYETAPFAQCHASTIAETSAGLAAAWFGGTRERHDDVGIWTALRTGKGWSAPKQVADGVENGRDYPCWNPVLYQYKGGPLVLFYKVGPNPRTWWGKLMKSADGGKTWSKTKRLPDGILGPIKNKPVLLANGSLLCASSTEHEGWRVHLEWTPDFGETWRSTEAINDGIKFGAIQPTVLKQGKRLQILCRSKQGKIVQSWSDADGRSWSPLSATTLPNPNSGIDGTTLADGRSVLIYNHTGRGRSPLNVAVTGDGKKWNAALVLENQPGEYSYPAVIQTSDGLVHITYTYKRLRVKHVVLNPKKLQLQPITDGKWPE